MKKEVKIAMITVFLLLSMASINAASAANTYNITDTTYSNYFNTEGNINDTSIVSGDILDLSGTINNKNMNIDRPLNITSSDLTGQILNGTITILPAGSGTSITHLVINNANQNGIVIEESNGNTITDNQITVHQDIASYGIHLIEASNNQINGNTINTIGDTITTTTYGVYLEGSSGNIFNSNTIHSTGAAADVDWSDWQNGGKYLTIGVFLFDGSNNNQLTGNTINTDYNPALLSGTGWDTILGVRIHKNSSTNTITSNTITTTGNSYTYGVEILGNNGNVSTGNTLSNNTINSVGNSVYANGVKVSGHTENTQVTGNTVTATAPTFTYGIYLENSGGLINATVDNNQVTTTSDVNYVIELYDVDGCTITNNTLTGVGNYSMGIGTYSSANNQINYNTITTTGDNNTPHPSNADSIPESNEGIKLHYNSDSNTIEHNTINSSDVYAINSAHETSNSNTIRYNYLYSDNGNKQGNNSITSGGDDTITDNYGDSPTTDFTATQTSGYAPLTVQFNDTTSDFPTTWAWDFQNDGTTDSTEQNPTYTYNTPGTYTVKLTTTNLSGSDDEIKTDYITATMPPVPIADFTAAPTNGSTPLTVQFTDESSNNPTAWSWDFQNDGTTDSTEQNPTYTYNTPGTYTVKLTTTNLSGSDEKVKTDYITVDEPVTPVANFTATPTSGPTPLTVQFNDTSSNDPKSWAWDFDNDGTTDSTEQNPTYTYNTPGTYTVKLTTTNLSGSDDEIKTDYVSVLAAGIADTAWPKFGGDINNTGQSDYTGPQNNITIWTYNTSGEIRGTPAIGADGTIYIGSHDNNLYAFNQDGTLKWTYTTGGSITSSATIKADGTIYIGSSDGKLYALNPDGTLKWTYTAANNIVGSPALASDGTIYFGIEDSNGKLYALNPDGTLKWTYTIGTSESYIHYGSPAIGPDGTIYFGSWRYKFFALNPDGTLKWSYTTGGAIFSAPVIGSDGTIYLGSCDDKKLFAFNPDGTVKWTYTLANKIMYGSPAIATDGTIYIGCADGKLYALNPDGTLKWTYSTGDDIYGSPIIGADGTIYIGSQDNNFYAINSDGTLKWTYTTGKIRSAPAIGADGTLYIGSQNGKFYAFKDEAPIADCTADRTVAGVPVTIQFIDISTGGSVSSWAWDFDSDGIIDSTEQNPTYTYTEIGNYTVTLTVTNPMGNSTKTLNITLSALPPVTDFTSDVTSGPTTFTVQFTDQSLYATSWAWDFENDGIIDSTEQNPTYSFNKAPGYYTVSLTATGIGGSTTTTKNNYILVVPSVHSSLPSGTYSSPQTVILTTDGSNMTIYYTNNTTDPVTSETRITYTEPITISNTTTLRAAAVDGSGNWTSVIFQNYVIGTGGLTDSAWPKFGGDLNNIGQSDYNGPQTNITKWTYLTGSMQYVGPSIGADGTIYIGGSSNLYAFNPDGTLKWNYTTGGNIYGSPAIGADGTIYIGSYDKKVYALNPDGTLKWNYTTGNRIYGSPAIGADGTIYIGSYDKKLYALNPDGTLKWNYTTGNYIYYATPAIGADGTIYIGSLDKKLYALNPDGTLKWKYTTGDKIYGSATIGSDGTIYIGSYDKKLYALNPDGTLKWNYITGNYIYGSPSIGIDGTIYIGSGDNNLYALNPDGTLKWNYTTGGAIMTSPIIGTDGTIYIGSYDKKVYALNPDGTLKWSYTTGGYIYCSPAIGSDGTLYIGSQDYTVYAFKDVPPVADFTADKTIAGVPVTIHFTDQSQYMFGGSYAWDFNGDGVVDSTQQNPSYTFTEVGEYIVSLTVTNVVGNSTKTLNIVLSTLTPEVDFTSDITTGTSPLTVNFTDQSQYATSWAWDFDNNGTIDSIQKNPTWTYNMSAGYYTVSLTATGIGGSTTTTKNNYILVIPSVHSSLPSGTYSSPQTVTLTYDGPDGTIYYTNNTTDPATSETRITYTEPITISNTTTLRAAAVDGSGNWTSVLLQNYVIGTGGLTDSSWPKFKGDNNNTGQSDYNGPQTNNTIWTYTTLNKIIGGAVIGTDGTIYFGDALSDDLSIDSQFYALNPDGTPKWTYFVGERIIGTPAIGADGTIYFGSYDGKLYALNPDGTLKWAYDTGEPVTDSPSIGADGTIYVGSFNGILYALNSDGTLKWNYNTGEHIEDSPTIREDGSIYITSFTYDPSTGTLHVLNSDGTLKWNYTGYISGPAAIGVDGTIYIGSGGNDGEVYALNPDGTVKWAYPTEHTIIAGPSIGTGGTIYVACGDYKVYALNPDGTLKWTYTTEDYVWSEPAIGADGTIYFGSDDKNLYALNPDGTLKWNYTTEGKIYGSPAISNNRTLYIGAHDKLFAFKDVALEANFTATPLTGISPLQIAFTSTSTGSITSYAWDFDNNSTVDSTEQNPTWIYQTPGTYTVKLTATGPGGSDDEIKTGYIVVSGTSDLMTSDLQVPSIPIIATPYPVSATVTNSGTADVSAFVVKLYDNNIQVAKINLIGLASGASAPVSFSWTPTTTGAHVLAITADANNEISESSETNNMVSAEVSVNSSTQPDLTVNNLQVPSTPAVGTTYPVTVTVTNQGTVDSGAFVVKLYDNNTQIAKINLTGLAAGTSTGVTFNWLTYISGAHNLSVIVDANQQITEYNEANNQISQQVIVGASTQPDLTVTNLQLPANPVAGTTYQITVTVTNNGTVDAAAFAVKLYDNNTQVMKVNLAGLAAGTSTQVTFNWTPTTGTHNLLVKADANNQITEYNENNNTITQQTTVL